jgi:hypothetical protein
MPQMLSLDVRDTRYWMLQKLIFDVVDVVCDVGCCVEEEGG